MSALHCENCGTHSDFHGETCMVCGLACINTTSIKAGIIELLEQEGDKFGVIAAQTLEGYPFEGARIFLSMSDGTKYHVKIYRI